MEEFRKEREDLNDLLLSYADMTTKRFMSIDSQVYREGILDRKTKEMLGLVASLVLRCDDCVKYHLDTCRKLGVTDGEMMEALSIGLVVGGSIVIPHLRRAVMSWDDMKKPATLP
jgi:AhpD family alkylhydroperoxidase